MKKILLLLIVVLSVTQLIAQNKIGDEFVKTLNGNWELSSRISNGKPANTEGGIFFNLTKSEKGFSGDQLATESGTLDAFVSGGGDNEPYEIASLFNLTISSGNTTSIKFEANGEITGSYGPFKKGIPSVQVYTFSYSKGAFTLQSQKHSEPGGKSPDPAVAEQTQVYDKIVLTKDKLIMSSSSLGLTDTYTRVSKNGGKIGGIFSLKKFYELFKQKITAGK
jgi:hypothetical protein